MKIALVMTVKNEERLLRSNILYHLAIGISDIFIYFDNSTDEGRASIENIENVYCFDSVEAKIYSHLDYLNKFTSQADKMHTARQCINTFDAMQRCKALKVDWLLSLDADELFLTSIDGVTNLKDFFESKSSFDVIHLSTIEVMARQLEYQNVMAEETLFKAQSRFKHWNDRIYFDFYNPYTHKMLKHPAWLGHTMGKCAVNIQSQVIPKNVHRFMSIDKSPLSICKSGFVLHYSLYDYKDFKKKFHNIKHRPDVFLNGKSLPKLAMIWRDMVNDPNISDDYVQNYYLSYLHINETKMAKFKKTRFFNIFPRKEAAIIEIKTPSLVLKTLE